MVSCISLTENMSPLSVSTSMPNSNVLGISETLGNQELYSTQTIRCHQTVLLMQKNNTTIKNSII